MKRDCHYVDWEDEKLMPYWMSYWNRKVGQDSRKTGEIRELDES